MNNKRKYKNLFAGERRFFRRKPAVHPSNNLNTTTGEWVAEPKQNSQFVYKSKMGVIKTKLEIELLHNILLCDHRQSLNACTQVPRKYTYLSYLRTVERGLFLYFYCSQRVQKYKQEVCYGQGGGYMGLYSPVPLRRANSNYISSRVERQANEKTSYYGWLKKKRNDRR